MTAITATRSTRVPTTTLWERTLIATSQRLERAAVHHMRHRAAAAEHEAVAHAVAERQRDAQAAGALRMFDR
ncbi:hypothetical protein LK09_04220 [Microbacterium mangrovi]|uniref:Uncharacterized protein n=1 Tax=Microbacterium mangrovi TaxID=1348253 RepID=A0A0B2A487_9MICO|nr:hypothetical protein [Microbacterium mangrovi]KHK98254.1 hypothetical protein LK09_04220 [Microbacterium mangrovi]